MDRPTITQLEDANPVFFSPEWGDKGTISDYMIEEFEGQWFFKVAAPHNTFPVYLINRDTFILSFVRHGWNETSLH